jgi:phosphatidylglycerophosphate synthase
MTSDPLSREGYLHSWSALHGGYSPQRRGIVRGYLIVMHVLARPFARAGVSPDAVTIGALLIAGIAPLVAAGDPGVIGLLLIAAVVAGTGLLDGVDGAVAIMRGRVTRWGSVLDSFADRVSELLYLLTLHLLGAPLEVIALGAVLSTLQEYVRARAGMAGMTSIVVVTLFERPTRIALTSLTAVGMATLVVLAPEIPVATMSAWAWVVLAAWSLLHLLVRMRRAFNASA